MEMNWVSNTSQQNSVEQLACALENISCSYTLLDSYLKCPTF